MSPPQVSKQRSKYTVSMLCSMFNKELIALQFSPIAQLWSILNQNSRDSAESEPMAQEEEEKQSLKLKIATCSEAVCDIALIAMFVAGSIIKKPYGAGGLVFSVMCLISAHCN